MAFSLKALKRRKGQFPLVRPWRHQCAPTWLIWQGGLNPWGRPQARQRWRVRGKQVGLGELQACIPDLGSVYRRRQGRAVLPEGFGSGAQAGRRQKAPAFLKEEEEEEEEEVEVKEEKGRSWGAGRWGRRMGEDDEEEDEEEKEKEEVQEVVGRQERGGRRAEWGKQAEVEVETEEEEEEEDSDDDDDSGTGGGPTTLPGGGAWLGWRGSQAGGGQAKAKKAWSEDEIQAMLNQAVLQVCPWNPWLKAAYRNSLEYSSCSLTVTASCPV